MTRTLIIITTIVTLLLVAGVAAVLGYIFVYPEYQARKVLEIANQDYQAERWDGAQRRYAWYLSRHPEATEVMTKYIDSNLRVMVNRPRALLNVGRAYITIARQRLEDTAYRDMAIGFLYRYGFWGELETLLDLYLKTGVDNPVLDYYQAVAVEGQGRLSEAEERYSDLIGKRPDPAQSGSKGESNPPRYPDLIAADLRPRDIFLCKARLLHQRGLRESARKLFLDWADLYEQDPQFLVQRAAFELFDSNTATADEYMRRAMSLADPETLGYEALVTAARIASELKDFDRTIEIATSAMKIDPKRPQAYLSAALAHLNKVDYTEAVALLSGLDQDVLNLYYQIYLLLAEIQLDTNDLAGAKKTVDDFRRYFPDHTVYQDYLEARGSILERQYEIAQEKLTNVINANPSFAAARLYLFYSYIEQFVFEHTDLENGERSGQGITQEEQRRLDDLWRTAQRVLDFYLSNNPGDTVYRDRRQRLFEGDRKEGIDYAKSMVKARRAQAEEIVDDVMDWLYEKSPGQTLSETTSERIESMLQRAIGADPANPSLYNILAQTYIEQRELEKARSIIEKGKQRAGRDAGFEVAEAAIALAEQDLDEAFRLRDTAFASPDFASASALPWAYLFARQEHLGAALSTLDQAVEVVEGEDRANLLADKVDLVLQYGTLEQAQELVDALTPQLEDYPAAQLRLADGRVALADRFLRRAGPEDEETTRALLDTIDAEHPGRPDVALLRARIGLREQPPATEAAKNTAEALLAQDDPPLPDLIRLMCHTILYDVAMLTGDTQRALDHIRKASYLFPNDPNFLLALGRTLIQNKEYEEALDQLLRVVATDRDNAEATELLVRAYTGAGQLAAAEAELARLRTLLAEDETAGAKITELEAWIRAGRGDMAQKEELLQQRLAGSPDNFKVLEELSWTIFAQRSRIGSDRAQEAIDMVREFMTDHQEETAGWTLLGNLYLQRAAMGEPERRRLDLSDASWAFSKACAVDKEYEDAILGLVSTNLAVRDTVKAEELLSTVLEIEGGESAQNHKVHALMAALLRKNGRNPEDAMLHIRRAIDLQQEQEPGKLTPAEYIALRGDLNLSLGRPEEAMKDMRELGDKWGIANAAMYANLAEIYLGHVDPTGDLNRALDYWKGAKIYYDAARAQVRADEDLVINRLDRVELKLNELSNLEPLKKRLDVELRAQNPDASPNE